MRRRRSTLLALALATMTLTGCNAVVIPKTTNRRAVFSTGFAALSQSLLLPAHADSSPNGPPMPGMPGVPGGRVPLRPTGDGISWTPPTPLSTNLAKSRIGVVELSPLNPKLSPFAAQELYYPPFLFGSWNVTSTLKRKMFPYGTEYLPSRSLIEGSPRSRTEEVGDPGVTYQLHLFDSNSKIILDRAHSARSISRSYRQLTPVEEVIWDPQKDPTRLALSFTAGSVGEDMRPLGQRKAEIYINARDSEGSGDVFCTAERSRIVMLGPGSVFVSDTETVTEYYRIDPNTVSAVSRIVVYLTPNPNSREGVLWQQIGGKAVAFYDYEMEWVRNEEVAVGEDGMEVRRACVTTPKDVVQCA